MTKNNEKKFINGFIKELPFKDAFRLTFKPEHLIEAIAHSEQLGKKYIDINLKRSKSGKMFLELDEFVPKTVLDNDEIPF